MLPAQCQKSLKLSYSNIFSQTFSHKIFDKQLNKCFIPQWYNFLKTKSDFSAALACRLFSDGNGCSTTVRGKGGGVQAHFKGCIATNPRVEGGICQKGLRRLLHRLLRLLNGALLFLKDLGTMLGLSEDGFCTCWTQN